MTRKHIVLCLDGTWNGPDAKDEDGATTPTNVQKVFEALKGSGPLGPADNEKEISAPGDGAFPGQEAKYIHGVGDTKNVLARTVEGAVGLGLVARIVRGYTYLSRTYQPGDDITILGFSRGAYAARALAGLVVKQGLLDWQGMQLEPGSEASYSAGLEAWTQYKQAAARKSRPGLLHGLVDAIMDLHDRVENGLHPAPPLRYVQDVPINAVAVWDTVGALGIPDIQENDESRTPVRVDVFQFADTALSPAVRYGFHAVAADEQRVDFTPTLWDARDGIVQVIFPGAHSDVGGGYSLEESGLSNGALSWMARQLASVGVMFNGMPAGTPDPLGVQHRPWVGPVPYRTALRQFPPGLGLSQRVVQRLGAKAVPVQGLKDSAYRPKNLSNSYVLLDWAGAAPHVTVVA